MKLNNILLAALAAGMFASCSDEPKTDTPTEGAAQGDGYLAVTIKLPTEKGNSRAANDNFDDGLASEYAVNDMWLVLFEGSSDADAKFNAAYKIDLPTKVGDVDNDNITTSYLTAVKVNKVEGGLMGLVMVNAQNIITVTDGALTVDGKPFTGTFAELNKIASDKPLYADGNFFMTNAPLSTVAGGKTQPSADNVQILVNLSNSLYTTEQEAKDNPAGSVYVERAVAKATLSANAATATIGGNNVEVSDIQWRLDNTEPTSYIVRNMGTAARMGYKNDARDYRFAGTAQMGTTSIQPAEPLFRTYWCEDPSYNIPSPALTTDVTSTEGFVAAGTTPLYCHENTFTVANQNYQNTTRAIVSAKLNGGTFWVVNGKEDQLYTKKDDATSFMVDYILNDDRVKAGLKTGFAANTENKLELNKDNFAKYVAVSYARDEKDGLLKVTAIKLQKFGDMVNTPAFVGASDEADIIAAVNGYYRIAEYVDGVNYYEVRFKHFAGDNADDENDLAPWSVSTPDTPTTAEAYAGANAAQNWLGRYGMVRNNWYDVTVTGFKHLGEPALPNLDITTDKTPDDKNEQEEWIAFKVNILSWAKRTQNVEF